jgi:RNA polymerase sigma-70 factor (ECF subfamily)
MMAEQLRPPARAFEREDEFASALAAHDQAAWRQLFEEQYDRVYRYAWLRTGNAADAEDIASSAFTEAVRGIGSYSYRGTPVASWLFRIAHNEAADLIKRRLRRQTLALQDDTAVARDDIARSDDRQAVGEALSALKPEHRDVLMLRLIEGRSVAETAAVLGKSEGSVKVTQMRALESVRRRLGVERRKRMG